MRGFARLVADLVADPAGAALEDWCRMAPPEDRVWALALLGGRAPPRVLTQGRLRDLARAASGLPDWLWAESQAASGDWAEVAARLVPPATGGGADELAPWMARLAGLRAMPAAGLGAAIAQDWACLDAPARVVWNRLLTGRFRPPVPPARARDALARVTGLPAAIIAGRLEGDWDPGQRGWAALTAPPAAGDAAPGLAFARILPLEDPDTLAGADWRADPLWPGQDVQLVLQGGVPWLWQADGALVTADHPGVAALARQLPPDLVAEGQIVGGTFRPRDLLWLGGQDLRPLPLGERLARLAALAPVLAPPGPLTGAPLAALRAWALAAGALGLLLRDAGRPRSDAPDGWLWRAEPVRLTAVLLYAHAGQGGALPEAFSFALPDESGALIPVARTLQGLSPEDLRALAAWARAHTVLRFGPVRQVAPGQHVEIQCDGISASRRHKAGLTLQAPRVTRWHREGGPQPTPLATLRALLG